MNAINYQSDLYKKCLDIAANNYLHSKPLHCDTSHIISMMEDSDGQWPESITPWQPFEYYNPAKVASYITELADSIYSAFYVEAYCNRESA